MIPEGPTFLPRRQLLRGEHAVDLAQAFEHAHVRIHSLEVAKAHLLSRHPEPIGTASVVKRQLFAM